MIQATLSWDAARAAATAHDGAFVSVHDEPGARVDGPLAGVPFAVKDNIDTADLPTTAGTPALRDSRPAADAPIVTALRAAGAVVLGKANMHELAFGITSNNAAFGPVHNPVDPARSAGGSSGGSAVAVALGIVAFALGTDTGGSVRIPAAHCGVVGMRPSTGRYPDGGIVPLSSTRDTPGFLARSVADVAYLDALVTGARSEPVPPLAGLRLGVPDAYVADLEREVERVFGAALDLLRAAGAVLVDVTLGAIPDLDARCGLPIVRYEARHDLGRYLAALPRALDVETVVARIASPDVAAQFASVMDEPVSEYEYRAGLRERDELRRQYGALFERHDVAALVYPTVPMLPPPLGDDRTTVVDGATRPVFATGVRNTSPGTLAGTPSISLPAGRSADGLPVGLALECPRGGDRRLLAVAAAVEAAISAGRTGRGS